MSTEEDRWARHVAIKEALAGVGALTVDYTIRDLRTATSETLTRASLMARLLDQMTVMASVIAGLNEALLEVSAQQTELARRLDRATNDLQSREDATS